MSSQWSSMAAKRKQKRTLMSRWARAQSPTSDLLKGWLRVHWAAGERVTIVQLPVYPCFRSAPNVQVEMSGDLRATVELAACWGLRVTVRRPTSTHAETAILRVWAEATIHDKS